MISYGAITVINAIPCGIGAAVGIDLRTKAELVVQGSERKVMIVNDPSEDTEMAHICVKNTFEHFGIPEPDGWSLVIDSEIPISMGLKSSSSACNSIVSSIAEWISGEYGKVFNDTLEMIKFGVKCAKEANVTITGAFDDACACHLGGLVITDNRNDTLISRNGTEEKDVIILIPGTKIRKPSLNADNFRKFSDDAKELIKIAENDWCAALTLNGKITSKAVGINDDIAKKAIELGALGAGITGTGPAISVVVEKGEGRSFLNELNADGYKHILTRTR
ncbi:MAG: shikimate kinase [Methanomassiliicoccaceae archaeon]|nr:shikimate kinase [Methanomassiliicoccaceae archaeon]